MTQPFHNLIGQESLKAKLRFNLDSFKQGAPLPHFLFTGGRGGGKSQFAKQMAVEIKKVNPRFEGHLINCATIKNVNSFYEQIYQPKIEGKYCILLLDESHNLPDIIQQLLLTTIEVDDKIERVIPTDSGDMRINTMENIFMFMSSEPDKLFSPLKDRMEVVALSSYKPAELGEILVKQCKEIRFHDGTVEVICDSLRGNPRDAIKASQGIKKYCLINRTTKFSAANWNEYCLMNDVKPYGLKAGEIEVLRVLAQNGACSLNDLRGATSISRTAIMNDLEPYLLSKHFIKIDGKRHITPKGREAWKHVESNN
jgi:Holliday junction resolvasome RuvABC ATP-dependent DNA helicase subunit